MDQTNKRPSPETALEASVKRPRAPAVSSDAVTCFAMEENDSEDELLNLLDLEPEKDMVMPASAVGKVRFVDDPYSSLLVFQSSSSYITINGNEESCGSSFSEWDTSVMASVDMSGLKLVGLAAFGKCMAEEGAREGGWVSGVGTDGCDGFDWDDEVLARFLGEECLFSDKH